MAREIKFRGRMKRTKQWMYGDLVHVQGQPCIQVDVSTDERRTVGMNVDPDSVGQFTGLHDKNGKEIYEGDILHVIAETDDTHDYITQVSTNGLYEVDLVGCEYDFTTLAWLSANYDECCTIEVIGNIYDNPELLKED